MQTCRRCGATHCLLVILAPYPALALALAEVGLPGRSVVVGMGVRSRGAGAAAAVCYGGPEGGLAAAPSDWLQPRTTTTKRARRRVRSMLADGWVLVGAVLAALVLLTAQAEALAKQHPAPLANQTAYRPASMPYHGPTNDAIDMTCEPLPAACCYCSSSSPVDTVAPIVSGPQMGSTSDWCDQWPRCPRCVDLKERCGDVGGHAGRDCERFIFDPS